MELIYIVVFSFIIRILPKLLLKESISADAYFHLYLKNELQTQNKIPKKLDRILLNNELLYPFGFHKLLSYFPKKYDLKIDMLSSAIIDCLYIIVVYFFVFYITNDLMISIYSAILTSISPAFLRVSSAPRAYNVTPRVFGEFLILLFFVSIILFSLYNTYILLLMAIFIVPFIILTGKFGTQVLLFFGITMLFFGNINVLLALLLGILLGYFIFGKIIIEIISAHYYHSVFYFKYNQKKYLWPLIITKKRYLQLIKRKFKEKKIIQWLYQENNLYHQLLFNYWPIFFIFCSWFYIDFTSMENLLFVYIIVSFIISLIISNRYFLFLGEAERYLEHTVFAQVVLFTIISIKLNLEILIIIYVIQSVIGYIYYVGIYKQYFQYSSALFKDMKELMPIIDKKGATLLPIAGLHWLSLYFSNYLKVVMTLNDNEKKFPYSKWKKILGNYPYPGDTIENIKQDIHFDYIIIRNDKIIEYEKILNDNIFSGNKLLLIEKKPILSLYKFKENNENK